MEFRSVGGSGLRVSLAGLGCNNFGGRIDETRRAVVSAALDAGITLFDTADIYGGAPVGGAPRRRARRAPRRCRRRDEVRDADGRRAVLGRRIAAVRDARRRGEPAPPRYRLHRPVPDARARPDDTDRGDARRAERPRAPGQGALPRFVELHRLADRRRRLDGAVAGSSASCPRRTSGACCGARSNARSCRRASTSA